MEPVYSLFTKSDGRYQRNEHWYQQLISNPSWNIEVFVTKHYLKHTATTAVADQLLCLQHFPQLFERFSSGVSVLFEKEAGKGYVSSHRWPDIKAINWLGTLSRTLPIAAFLMNDPEASMHCLIGKYISKAKAPLESLNSSMCRINLDVKQVNEVYGMLFNYACFFYVFCIGTGFDPTNYIDRVYKIMKMPCPINDIIHQCNKNIEIGNPYGIVNLN